jgi:hypothetical protein
MYTPAMLETQYSNVITSFFLVFLRDTLSVVKKEEENKGSRADSADGKT